jgi:23S rRNA (guanosine2251-2'-O)-methyltransferase
LDNFIFGIRAVLEAIAAEKDIDRVLLQAKVDSELQQELFKILREKEIPFQFVPVEKLNRITRKNHQGAVAFISQIEYTPLEEMVAGSYESGRDPFILILDHLSDVRNFGAIARTAECAGLNGIVIPEKGSVSISADAVKTSAGALMTLPVARVRSLRDSVWFLKDAGLSIFAATEKTDTLIFDLDLSGPIAIILGAEDTGVSPGLLDLCDYTMKIPLFGKIESLNVSVAASVIIYEVIRQRLKSGSLN